MKVLHHKFKTEEQFIRELHNSSIPLDHPHILVQIFDGNQNIKTTKHLLGIIQDIMPHSVIAGLVTNGEILNDQILEGSLLISVIYFEDTRLQVTHSTCSQENSFDSGKQLGQQLQKDDLVAALIFGEGLSVNGEELLAGFESQVGDIVIAGGLTIDNSSSSRTYLFYQDKIVDSGAVAIGLYSTTLRAETRWSFDCDIIGDEFTVTKSSNNIVYKIDDMTPEALYAKQLGVHLDRRFIEICSQIPLVTIRNEEILARSPLTRYDGGAIGFAGNLIEGEKVRLSIANKGKILRSRIELYNSIESQWDAIHIFSCVGRKIIMGDDITRDVQHFRNIAPAKGFFAYGEFVKEKHKPARFCNQTLVLLLLSESADSITSKPLEYCEYSPASAVTGENSSGKVHSLLNEQLVLMEHKNKISEQLALMEQKNRIMEKMLYEDPLTKLRSRTFLLQEIEAKNPRGVVLFDIRNFHIINDLYGESVGNLILKSFANFMKKQIEPTNVYRLSGNTFAVLNIYDRTQQECIAVAKKVISNIQAENFSFRKGDSTLECAISLCIGISNERGGKHLLEQADMALNYAKKHHKEFVVYSDSLNIRQGYELDISIVKMVKKALDEDRIVPYFQPIFRGEEVSYYEALIRLVTEDGKVLTPFHFLDVIKRTSYYSDLTRRMIKKSFAIFQQLDSKLSINLSSIDFFNTDTMDYLLIMIAKYDMGDKLILEILEGEIFEDYESTNEQIERFRSLGVKIAIDDFGSGYSNFLHLTLINPDFIKIDGSLIKNIDKDNKSLAICRAIIGFARELKMKTIAEFIHSKDILDITTDLKVDKHQGFYLGEPRSAEELFQHLFTT